MAIRGFRDHERGAVTTNWVVMTSAVVGISMAVMLHISGGLENASGSIFSSVGEPSSVSGLSQEITQTTPATPSITDTIQALREAGVKNKGIKEQLAAEFKADAPEGYKFDNRIDVATGLPVYRSIKQRGTPRTYSIGGEVITEIEYHPKADSEKLGDYVKSN